MICLIRDISDSEAQEQALRAERQRFDLFIDAVRDYAIFMLDPDGYVTSWNTGAERLKGYTEDDILGNHFSVFYTEEQREAGLPERLLEEALANGSVEHVGPRVRKDGTTFQAGVVLTAVHNEDDSLRGFGKVTRNTSEDSR
jgi:PAS domain S-box-containing protein